MLFHLAMIDSNYVRSGSSMEEFINGAGTNDR